MTFRRLGPVARRSAVVAALALAACSSPDEPVVDPTRSIDDIESDSAYEVELVAPGSDPRVEWFVAVPVGRTHDVVVEFVDADKRTVTVDLVVEVVRAAADGGAQRVDLEVVGVTGPDDATTEAYRGVVGATSSLDRDARGAVIDQRLEVDPDLGFRSDTLARQALRAPFAVVGPVPRAAVGAGGSWTITIRDEQGATATRTVAVDEVDEGQLVWRGEVEDGSYVLQVTPGELLPTHQEFSLADGSAVRIRSSRQG